MTTVERVLLRWADSEKKDPLKNTQDLLNEMSGIRLQVSKLDNQIKHSTSITTRNTWVRSRNQLAEKHNKLLADYEKFTGKESTAKKIPRR
jgi:hypothetical protein